MRSPIRSARRCTQLASEGKKHRLFLHQVLMPLDTQTNIAASTLPSSGAANAKRPRRIVDSLLGRERAARCACAALPAVHDLGGTGQLRPRTVIRSNANTLP